jgi:hypothetical protein
MMILAAMVCVSFILFSYARTRTSNNSEEKENCDAKCGQKKVQNEYILFESLTHNLFSVNY